MSTGNPFLGGEPVTGRSTESRRPARTSDRTSIWVAVAMSVVFNLVTVIGVVEFDWPPGNVFVLFWAENVILGLTTLVKIGSAHGPTSNRVTSSLFFCLHYGIFCAVQAVFTGIIAYQIGLRLTFALFWFPVILIMIRYLVETATVWFGRGGQRDHITPQQAMGQPYPRIMVLQFAVIASFFLLVSNTVSGSASENVWVRRIQQLAGSLPGDLGTRLTEGGVLYVLILIVIKTLVDLGTTYRAVSR